jgi:membrane fusion protein (multidrug efflux system)
MEAGYGSAITAAAFGKMMNLNDRDTGRLPRFQLPELPPQADPAHKAPARGNKTTQNDEHLHDHETPPGLPSIEPAPQPAPSAPEAFGKIGENSDPAPARRPWLKPLLIVGVIALVAAGIAYRMWASHFQTTDDAFVEAHVVQVSPRVAGHVARVLVTDNQQVRAGDLLAELDSADLDMQLAQAQAGVDEARAELERAQVNVELTSVTAHAAYQQATAGSTAAQAQVGSAQAQLTTNQNRTGEAQATIQTAQANSEQARSSLKAAQADATRLAADAKRSAALFASKTISREEYEHALTASQAASARVNAAQDQLNAALAVVAQAQAAQKASQSTVEQYRSQVGAAEAALQEAQARQQAADVAEKQIAAARAQLETAQADLKSAEAKRQQARLELSYTKITAPADGQVTRRTVEAGNYVQTGQALMALVRSEKWVVANFKETQLKLMRPGQEAEVKVDSYKGKKLRARVDSIQSGTGSRFSLLPAENATGNFVKVVQRVPVKLVFTEPLPGDAFVAPGGSVEARVRVK